ncbi:13846_t:CDS:2 [Gigaspora rosea]|nr:13846_t:CDS:2 [Gigaspora rosea]
MRNKAKEENMRRSIEAQGEMIVSDQHRMLNSILNRYGDKIVIDRLVINRKSEDSRRIKVEKMDDKWKAQYSPIEVIDKNWYKELTEKISEQE